MLDPATLLTIFQAEMTVFKLMEEKGYGMKCNENDKCLEPLSLIFMVREYLYTNRNNTNVDISFDDYFRYNCKHLIEEYRPNESTVVDYLAGCEEEMRIVFNLYRQTGYITNTDRNVCSLV